MDEQTIRWILTDSSVDPVSKVPTSAVVFMLYYGLELKHFLLKISEDIVTNFNPGIRDYKDTSLYLAGSAAQGFYLNTNDFLDARDMDIVSILRKEVRKECEFDKEQLPKERTGEIGDTENREQCKGILKDNSTLESPPMYLNVETWEDTYPGYVMLRKCRKDELPVQTSLSHRYVSSLQTTQSRTEYWNEIQSILADVFRSGLDDEWGSDVLVYEDVSTQGPAASSMFTNIFLDVQLNSDLVFALPYPGWPEIAREWQDRVSSSGWPSLETKQDIIKSGCLIVPKGQLGSRVEEYEWRISFSFAELKLSRTLSRVQREIVHVMKAFFSDKKEHGYLGIEAKLDSYFVINLLYTESEKLSSDEWTDRNTAKMVFHLLEKLISCIEDKKLPHYFIPANNLLHKYTFKSVKLSKGEFKLGYGDEGEMMDIGEYIDYARYAVMRLRYDPLGQLLQQSKYVQLTGSLRKAVFEPLVKQAKESLKVDGNTYFLTLLRLAKAHFFQLRFREAYFYTEDAMKFYKALEQPDVTGNIKFDLQMMRALTSYLTGRYDSAKEFFELLEKQFHITNVGLTGKPKDVFFVVYARTIVAHTRKYRSPDEKDFLAKSEKMLKGAVEYSSESYGCVIYFDLLNFYLNANRYEEAESILDEIKTHLGIANDTDNSEFITDIAEVADDNDMSLEEEQISHKLQEVPEAANCHMDESVGLPVFPDCCTKDSSECSMAHEPLDASENKEICDKTSLSSDEGVGMESVNQNADEIIYRRTPCEENDKVDCQYTSEKQDDADSKLDNFEYSDREHTKRTKLNLSDHQDLLNHYALFEAFRKLGLNDIADSVHEKLLKKVQNKQGEDNTVTIEAIENDYNFYMSLNVDEPLDGDWEDPFKIFRDHVVLSVADELILDDILKSLVQKYGAVRLSLHDMYYHFCILLQKKRGKDSANPNLIDEMNDQDLKALHYQSIGDIGKAQDAEFYARLDSDGGGKLVAETLRLWVEKLLDAARKYEPRNVYLDSVFS